MSGSSHFHSGTPRTESTLGLPVAVILLRRDGQRITGDKFKAAVPFQGYLLLGPAQRRRCLAHGRGDPPGQRGHGLRLQAPVQSEDRESGPSWLRAEQLRNPDAGRRAGERRAGLASSPADGGGPGLRLTARACRRERHAAILRVCGKSSSTIVIRQRAQFACPRYKLSIPLGVGFRLGYQRSCGFAAKCLLYSASAFSRNSDSFP